MPRLPAIFHEVERQWLMRRGITKVRVETPSGLGRETKVEIERIVKGEMLLEEKINPELLAGIKILVDGEMLIDASGRRGLERLFISTQSVAGKTA